MSNKTINFNSEPLALGIVNAKSMTYDETWEMFFGAGKKAEALHKNSEEHIKNVQDLERYPNDLNLFK